VTRAVDLFAGAGGLSHGLGRAGVHVVEAYEANGYACATHQAAHPHTDVREGHLTGGEDLPEDLELLCGGPPCQPFSGAGLKLGEHDPRDGYPIVLRLLERHQPRAVLLENVKGLLGPKQRPYFERVLVALRTRGYHVRWRCLQAADYGVPQRRERVFIVAFRDEADVERWVWPEPTHSLEALVQAKYIAGGFDEADATRAEAPACEGAAGWDEGARALGGRAARSGAAPVGHRPRSSRRACRAVRAGRHPAPSAGPREGPRAARGRGPRGALRRRGSEPRQVAALQAHPA